MSAFSLTRFLDPARLLGALQRRGAKGSVLHAARRLGTQRETATVGPDFLRINPMGTVCNHTCPMCWLQHITPEELKTNQKNDRELGMRLDAYEKLFDSMPPGLEEVNVVGGGEPLIHPEIIGILQAIKRRGLRGSLITNGTLLKEDKSRAIIEMQWDYVRISVHAGDRETFKAVQGVDRFDILLENLKTFSRLRNEAEARNGGGLAKPKLAVLHVLQPANINSIDKLFAFGEEAGVDEMIIEKVVALDPSLRLTAEDYRRGAEALKSCAAASSIPCNLDEILGQMRLGEACEAEGKPFRPGRCCTVGFDQSYINSMGEVFPCCFSNEKMGDLKEASFRDIWFGPKYSAFRKRLVQGKFAKYCIENRCAIRAVLQD